MFNYTLALECLTLAEEIGKKDKRHFEEVEARISVERLFIAYEAAMQEETRIFLRKISPHHLKHIPDPIKAFYWTVLAGLASKDKQFEKAEKLLTEAIYIFQKEDPKHLPYALITKMEFHKRQGQKDKVLEAFEEGIRAAQQYQSKYYTLVLHYTLTQYYLHTNSAAELLSAQEAFNKLWKAYDTSNILGQLNIIEQKHLGRITSEELEYAKSKVRYSTIMTCILFVLFGGIGYLFSFRKNKYKPNSTVLLHNHANLEEGNADLMALTDRQRDIIELVKRGKTNKEIGEILFISENTVKYHLKAIYSIMGVDSRHELKRKAAFLPPPTTENVL